MHRDVSPVFIDPKLTFVVLALTKASIGPLLPRRKLIVGAEVYRS